MFDAPPKPGPIVRAVVASGVVLLATSCADDARPADGSRTPSPTSTVLAGEPLLDRLRAGGNAIVIRHAATDADPPDADPIVVGDCSTQRNLSAQGRADAAAIGQAVRELAIPIGEVFGGTYCRTTDTVTIAFGHAAVAAELDGRDVWPPNEQRRRLAGDRLASLMRDRLPSAGGTNVVMGVHQLFPQGVDGTSLTEGEAVVYTIEGGEIVKLAELGPGDWRELASAPSAVPDGVLDGVVTVRGEVTASGFRVGIPNIAVTNAHVVGTRREVEVVLPDGSIERARVVGTDPALDIAALEIPDTRMPALHSADGLVNARPTDSVFLVGSPHAAPTGYATSVTLRSVNYPLSISGGGEFAGLQVDRGYPAEISGGPLVDRNGHVLGVLSARIVPGTDQHLGYAIPVDAARDSVFGILANR